MTIDWSKAPEGYDYHLLGKSNVSEGKFYRAESDRFRSEAGGYVLYADLPENLFFITSRPPESAAWVGLGLPPVGTVCEFKSVGHHSDPEYLWCIYYGEMSCGGYIVEFHHHTSPARTTCDAFDPALTTFRPIRTPEQIEAEARKAAIEQICIDAGSPDMTPGQLNVAAKLYDAGYRKQERS